MPIKQVDAVLSANATKSASKSSWRYGYNASKDRFAGAVQPRELCSTCYDALRSEVPGLSRIVQSPGKKLRCTRCKKVYSNGGEGRKKRKAA